mgnify:FL=1
MAGIGFGAFAGVDNYKVEVSNGLGPRTLIVSIAGSGGDVSQTELDAFVAGVTSGASLQNGNTDNDTFTVAGIAGTVGDGAMHVALQGTGTLVTDAGEYAANVTPTVVVTFDNDF